MLGQVQWLLAAREIHISIAFLLDKVIFIANEIHGSSS